MKNRLSLLVVALIAGVTGLAYLPLAARFGYSYDDWYLMWVAKAYGPQAFHAIFAIDRPLRAYLMIPAYALFGENAFWYNLSAYLFRVSGGLAFWWMLDMLWPKAKTATISMALLFVIYPGFLSQPNAIDYQSHIVALALALFSLALTVKAFQMPGSVWKRLALLVVSMLTGWIYLGLMEYYIGFELIRFLLIVLLAVRSEQSWPAQVKRTIWGWLPLAIVPVGFVFWRVFIFVSERKATDAGEQLGLFMISPLHALFNWLISLLGDVWAVLVTAWVIPLAQLLPGLALWQVFAGLGLGLLSIAATLLVLKRIDDDEPVDWRREALWFGLASVLAGLIPVVLANRQVAFPYFSRYTLISSTGAVMAFVALIYWIPRKTGRQIVFSALILVATLTHFGNSVKAAAETDSLNNFWWQVAWRIPMLEKNTTLVVWYPLVSIQEDYFVWGPANFIYYPQKQNPDYMQPGVYAVVPNEDAARKIVAQEHQVYDKRREIITYTNYRNILVLSQPTLDACVHVLDGAQVELSSNDSAFVKTVAPFSEFEHILTNGSFHQPPQVVFGAEPVHGWCYFYQKAAFARQTGDWAQAAGFGDEALKQGLAPSDEIEWLPFIQAYAALGSNERLSEIGANLRDESVRAQACQRLSAAPNIPATVQVSYCTKK